ncbi:MAG: glycosyltransferase family 1 protein [Lutispora sp.]
MIIGIDGRAAYWYRGTGIGTYVYQLIYKQSQLDQDNHYYVLIPQESQYSFIWGDNFHKAPVDNLRKDKFWEELQINEVLLDRKVDLYHIPQNGIGMPQKKICPFVVTLHDVIPITMPETVGPYYCKKFLDSIPEILDKSDAIITVSEFSKQDICKELGVSPNKVFVSRLAAENIYSPMNKHLAKAYINQRYGIEDEFFLYVGGFNPRKNIESLLTAYACIKEKLNRDYKVVILGKPGRSYENLVKLCDELKISECCIFTGFIPVSDMPWFYNAASVFIYPSLYEGFGLPVVEAMACGTPVITSNITSLPEVAGDGAITVSPMDYDAIGDNLLCLVEDEKFYADMSKKALQRAAMYSWDKTVRETLEVYKRVALP